ncbi:MAG TPA: EAL domain-containing protein [Polyangiaceae bacterium]|jgi:EAL domain-containing protein (putative c-di-GMP-specific phosphodiesterase class I)
MKGVSVEEHRMQTRVAQEPKGRILVVDDNDEIRRANERVLIRAGYEVEVASDGLEALEKMEDGGVDTIVSDISMPKMDGIALLRTVREGDLDLPVLLLTGEPKVETAVEAIQHGALRYLIKPVPPEVLEQEVQYAVRLYAWAKLRRVAEDEVGGDPLRAGDRAGLAASFGRALARMWMAYQPIVSCAKKEIIGYEALMRTDEESLHMCEAILRASERLGRCADIGRTVRRLVATSLTGRGGRQQVFVNLHVRDLLDESLYDPYAPLGSHADHVVLEVTERAALDEISDVGSRVTRLRQLGFRIAVDDLGAGYSSLTSLAQLQPDVVKLDMSLIRDVHKHPIKQKLVSSFATLSKDMGITLIAEGVETVDERDTLLGLGCDVFQGFLFARPAQGFPEVDWQ